MENQHRMITGYRELSQEEIDLMNEIKAEGERLQTLMGSVKRNIVQTSQQHGTPDAEHHRWASIARTHFQEGLMALTRAVAKPQSF